MNTAELPSFWVTNITKKDVLLDDLGVRVRSWTSINLLDHKHYPHITLEMCQKSEASGTLFKKKTQVAHRKVPPENLPKDKIQRDAQAIIPNKPRSTVVITEAQYEELNIVDEEILNTLTNLPTSPK